MAKCKHETKNGRCGLKESYAYRKECYTEECFRCHDPIEPCGRNEPQTNADRIRAMSDEELVKLIGHNSLCDQIQNNVRKWCEAQAVCDDCLLEWLKQPAEVNENE